MYLEVRNRVRNRVRSLTLAKGGWLSQILWFSICLCRAMSIFLISLISDDNLWSSASIRLKFNHFFKWTQKALSGSYFCTKSRLCPSSLGSQMPLAAPETEGACVTLVSEGTPQLLVSWSECCCCCNFGFIDELGWYSKACLGCWWYWWSDCIRSKMSSELSSLVWSSLK